MKKRRIIFPLIILALVFSAWGYKGHRIINQNAVLFFPYSLAFLQPDWANIVILYASEADNRKYTDPNESPKHYIDIDNYPEFLQTGHIPTCFDSVVALHGYAFVLEQGILPWATLITFDSLQACFERHDWLKSALFAADLGHYLGDGHMPLHITRNYDGQFTGQHGVHARYESRMIGRYEALLVYPADSVHFIGDVTGFVFSNLYYNYQYVDSILMADNEARAEAGNTTSDAYYQALWNRTAPFTIDLLKRASGSLADLIFTAWVRAGSPVFYPLSANEPVDLTKPRLLQSYPDPFTTQTTLAFEIRDDHTPVMLLIYDVSGNLVDTLIHETLSAGYHKVTWDATTRAPGVYICALKSEGFQSIQKLVRVK